MHSPLLLLISAMAWLLAGANAPAQNPAQPQHAPAYTLDVGTDLVIEDVSVTDRHGNPVEHLPASAFHIRDNDAPQVIRDFSEQSHAVAAEGVAGPRDTFTNASLYSNSGAVVAMLIDPVSIPLADQMFLRLQMLKYLKNMPEGTPVAIFRADSRGIPVLIQSLTSDRSRLIAAVNTSVPGIPRPADTFSNAMAELENIAGYFRPVPGKKILLWFSGRFPLYLDPDLCSVIGPMTPTINSTLTYNDCGSMNAARRDAYRMLAQARVAVYPIDVRGVLMLGPPSRPATSTSLKNSPGSIGATPVGEISKINGEYDDMDQLAKATGGRAYYSDNALAEAMTSAVDLGEHAYSVTYRPEPYKQDGAWHKVRITVDGPYTVRYRTGYYAAAPAAVQRARLAAHGTVLTRAEPARTGEPLSLDAQTPIVFTVHLQRSPRDAKGSRYTLEYDIPSAELQFQPGADGRQHARFRLAAMAYTVEGDVLSDAIDSVETSFTPEQMQLAARIGTPALQTVEVRKGARFLLLAVQDLGTQRVGTLQVPVDSITAQAGQQGRAAKP